MSPDRPALALLRLEGLAVLFSAAFVYNYIGASFWLFALLFLAPDLALAGYLGGPRIGASCYNLMHAYVGPLALLILGIRADSPAEVSVALIWLAHIGMDRALGYGLKSTKGFGITHLSRIRKDGPE